MRALARQIRPLVLLKKVPSWGLGQRVNQNWTFLTGGGRLGGVSITAAATEDVVGTPNTGSIAFTLSECVYLTSAPLTPISDLFTYYLNGTEISKTLGVAKPTPDGITIPSIWEFDFAAGTIATARGSGTDVWEDGDVLTMELDQASADLLQIRDDCVFANINADDPVMNPIGLTPVENLYNAPVALSASVTDANTIVVSFDQVVSDDGVFAPTDPNGALIHNCSNAADLTITGVSGNGTNTLTYAVTGSIIAGDIVQWTSAGVAISCPPVVVTYLGEAVTYLGEDVTYG